MAINQKNSGNYPIQGVPDNVEDVAYRTQRKGWITQALFDKYFREPRVIGFLPHGETRRLHVERCNFHNDTDELKESIESVEAISNELYRFTPNYTAKIQPLDQLLLRSFKEEWRKRRAKNVFS